MNNLQKFFEEVYRESKMLHLTEITVDKMIDAILQDFPNLDNHNQQELVKLALETWFGPSGTGDYTSDEIDSMWNRYNQTGHLF